VSKSPVPFAPETLESIQRAFRLATDLRHDTVGLEHLLLALVDSGLERDAAYRAVQRHAMRAWDEGLDFRGLVRADVEIAGRVDVAEIFDMTTFTTHADVVFMRLEALAADREEVRT